MRDMSGKGEHGIIQSIGQHAVTRPRKFEGAQSDWHLYHPTLKIASVLGLFPMLAEN